MDVVRSALLAGEIDDAYKVVFNAVRRLDLYRRSTGDRRYDVYFNFLTLLQDVLEGKKGWKSISDYIRDNPDISKYVDSNFLSSFPYYLFYSVDRYNVRFPYFDGKRCDDR